MLLRIGKNLSSDKLWKVLNWRFKGIKQGNVFNSNNFTSRTGFFFFSSQIPTAAAFHTFPKISNTWSCAQCFSSFWHIYCSVITEHIGKCQGGKVTPAVAQKLSSWLQQDATEGLGTWSLSSLKHEVGFISIHLPACTFKNKNKPKPLRLLAALVTGSEFMGENGNFEDRVYRLARQDLTVFTAFCLCFIWVFLIQSI